MGSHLEPEEGEAVSAKPLWTPSIPPRSPSRRHPESGEGASFRPLAIERFFGIDHELHKAQSQSFTPLPLNIEERSLSDSDDELQRRRLLSASSFDRSASTLVSHVRSRPGSAASTYQTNTNPLYPLQTRDGDVAGLEPLDEEELDPASFDLLAPASSSKGLYSLEKLSLQLFSRGHLEVIFADPVVLQRFTGFIRASHPASVPLLDYYLDAVKALKAINYANRVIENLGPLDGLGFSHSPAELTANEFLQEKADRAFEELVHEELPAFITHTWIRMASLSIKERITGTLSTHLREMSEGLAEVFCLTDPTREDNPVVFASEEFYRTTQYGRDYVLGRNCRFLQGPMTSAASIGRLRRNLASGKEYCETILNYRRDGSPFMNLLMCAPLLDSRGITRYMIGAQIDVSGLAKDCAGLDSLRTLIEQEDYLSPIRDNTPVDPLQSLSEMFTPSELETVRTHGGRIHEGTVRDESIPNWQKPRVVTQDPAHSPSTQLPLSDLAGGRLAGAYENYLLVRPFPSLKILFASPSLRIPGILQSPFLSKIGGSEHVREELLGALEDGTVVTARVQWVGKLDKEGRPRWIHCTPLVGRNGAVGVWVVVIVDEDDEEERRLWSRGRGPPVVEPARGKGRRPRTGERNVGDYPNLEVGVGLEGLGIGIGPEGVV